MQAIYEKEKCEKSGLLWKSFPFLLAITASPTFRGHSLGVVQGLVAGVFAPKTKFHPGQVASLGGTYHHPYHRLACAM